MASAATQRQTGRRRWEGCTFPRCKRLSTHSVRLEYGGYHTLTHFLLSFGFNGTHHRATPALDELSLAWTYWHTHTRTLHKLDENCTYYRIIYHGIHRIRLGIDSSSHYIATTQSRSQWQQCRAVVAVAMVRPRWLRLCGRSLVGIWFGA
jgi:hypothetical protein